MEMNISYYLHFVQARPRAPRQRLQRVGHNPQLTGVSTCPFTRTTFVAERSKAAALTSSTSKRLPNVNSPCKAVVFKRTWRSNTRFKNDPPRSAIWRGARHDRRRSESLCSAIPNGLDVWNGVQPAPRSSGIRVSIDHFPKSGGPPEYHLRSIKRLKKQQAFQKRSTAFYCLAWREA